MTKEQKFYKALQDVFIGAKIECKGGFVNLMRIKSNYYRKIEDILKKDIESALENYPSFRDELFDKLYSFFNRYFTESGSIYFNSTPFHNNIYEKVYTDEKDVILFWKTQMLYRRHGGVRKELGVKTPFQAVEKWFMLKPEIFKQNPCIFKNKILCLQSNKSPSFHKQPCET